MARSPDFSLTEALRSPSFTPAVRDVAALLDLLGAEDEGLARDVERALLRVGRPALDQAMAQAPHAPPRLRARLCRLIGRAMTPAESDADVAARQFLLARLLDEDEDPKTRRSAAMALGHRGARQGAAPSIEDALCRVFRQTRRPDLLRSVAAALGKIGSQKGLDLLLAVRTDDPELRRIAEQAALTLTRTLAREDKPQDLPANGPSPADSSRPPSEPAGSTRKSPDPPADRLRLDRAPPRGMPIVLRCRDGLERLLETRAAAVLGPSARARAVGPGRVDAWLSLPPAALFEIRLWLRFGWMLDPQKVGPGEEAADAVVRALSAATPLALMQGFAAAAGPPSFRLSFARGGHRRAEVWRIARQLFARQREILNDPTRSDWEAVVYEGPGTVHVELCPRGFADPRFAYRQRDVPAASHPTLAAALCQVAGLRADDIVFDPFVGSGLELCERALLGPCAALYGGDIHAGALDAARANLSAIGRGDIPLFLSDARTGAPPRRPTLILTNPPMGRRVSRDGDLCRLLEEFLANAGRILSPGGRLVWISPLPERCAEFARQAGLRPGTQQDVDMGGFTARIQVFHKPA